MGCRKGLIPALSGDPVRNPLSSGDPAEKSLILWRNLVSSWDLISSSWTWSGNESDGGCQGLFGCKDVVPISLMLAPAIC